MKVEVLQSKLKSQKPISRAEKLSIGSSNWHGDSQGNCQLFSVIMVS